MIKLIVAASVNGVIGVEDRLPFNVADDLKIFKLKTEGCIVVMGRKTYESLPDSFKPLPNRLNVVASLDLKYNPHPGVIVTNDLVGYLKNADPSKDIWVIGGGNVYKQAVEFADEIHLTTVSCVIKGDTYFHIEDHMDDFKQVNNQQFIDTKSQMWFTIGIWERKK